MKAIGDLWPAFRRRLDGGLHLKKLTVDRNDPDLAWAQWKQRFTDGAFLGFPCGVSGKGEPCTDPSPTAAGTVVDRSGQGFIIGNDHETAILSAQSGGPQSHLFDRAFGSFGSTEAHVVSQVEGPPAPQHGARGHLSDRASEGETGGEHQGGGKLEGAPADESKALADCGANDQVSADIQDSKYGISNDRIDLGAAQAVCNSQGK